MMPNQDVFLPSLSDNSRVPDERDIYPITLELGILTVTYKMHSTRINIVNSSHICFWASHSVNSVNYLRLDDNMKQLIPFRADHSSELNLCLY